MTDKLQIDAAAENLVRRFGKDALRQADIRIRELEQHGKADSLEFWRDIRSVVRQILDSCEGPVN